LTKQSQKLLDKLGVLVHFEITGFLVTLQTVRDLRRKLLRTPILEHPYLNLLEAKKAEKRQQKLAGRSDGNGPLAFGDLAGLTMEDMQMEHVLELRQESLTQEAGRALPALCPPDLSADRHLDVSRKGEELLLRHLRDAGCPEAEATPEAAGGRAGAQSPPPSPPSPGMPGAGSPLARRNRASLRRFRVREASRLDESERKQREEAVAKLLAAPLPTWLQARRSLRTGGVSPMLDLLAPGVGQQAGEAPDVKMRPPAASFLPRIAASASEPAPGGSRPSSADAPLSDENRQPLARQDAGQGSRAWAPRGDSKQRGLPKLESGAPGGAPAAPGTGPGGAPHALEVPPLRVKPQAMNRRIAAELEGFKRGSFDHYKKDFDMLTGTRKMRLDGGRLRTEEAATLKRTEALLGSASAPALRLLRVGVPPAAGGARRAAAGTGRRAGTAAAPLSGATSGASSPTDARGRRPWNELTTVHA